MEEMPQRRWFRYSLRALLVLVAIVAIWLGWSLNWVLQRRHVIRNTQFDALSSTSNAPWSLRPFGETGVELMVVLPGDESDLDEARRLFPEAEVVDGRYVGTVDE